MSALAKEVLKTYYTAEDYFALPDGVRAELIGGVFYDMAPPNWKHQRILFKLSRIIADRIEKIHPECEVVIAPYAVKLRDDRDDYFEPDISVICDREKLKDWGCEGPPDWIIEIVSPGNASHDYIKKATYYMDAGVREYWIVDPIKEKVVVHSFQNEEAEDRYGYEVYTFRDKVPVGICEGFEIDFAEIGE